MRLITRRRFVIGGAAAAVLTAGAGLIEPRRVTVERNRIVSGSTGPTVRLVQLSDLHLQNFDAHARAVVRRVNELNPDIVALTGDAIDKPDRIDALARFLEALDTSSAKVATLGNWEHWARVDLPALKAAYEAHACALLVNESLTVAAAGGSVVITGMDDSTGGRPDAAAAFDGVGPAANHIVLAHSPAYRDTLSTWVQRGRVSGGPTIACVLSGHTHGGQINLLGWAPVRPPGSGPYVSGWYRNNGLPLYVSRGIGTSIAPVRLGSPPEISLFEWQTAAA